MKTLTSSYLKFSPHKYYGEKDRVFWCIRGVAPMTREVGFLGHQKHVVLGFTLPAFSHRKSVHFISAVASARSSENQTRVESEEIQIECTDQSKTTRVRFKLHKECAFGQHFVIVGDDPIFGLWDPSDGVTFTWSDGHVWTAQMDIPCGKVIKYKFILKTDTETITWQPGPDRILQIWDTEKTITVFEDWENFELQNIIEEEEFIGEKFLVDSIVADEEADVNEKLSGTNGYANIKEKNVEGKNKLWDLGTSDEAFGITSLDKEVRVLVPGLNPKVTEVSEEELLNGLEKENVVDSLIGSDEAEEINMQEWKDEVNPSSTRPTEGNETMIANKQELYGKEQMEIWEGDKQWGRQMVQKFLSNLGFQLPF